MSRVFVTGMGVISSLGNSPRELFDALLADRTGVRRMDGWDQYVGLKSFVAAPALPYDAESIDRSVRRTMSPMSTMGLLAARQALAQAQVSCGDATSARMALCLGSTTGSPQGMSAFFKKMLENGGPRGQLGTAFFRVMNHSAAANIAIGLGFRGAVSAPSAACCTATQALAMGWEMLQTGLYDVVIAGGTDELDFTSASVFDIVGAASTGFNDSPTATPRPFDRRRDGLVVSEGAGILVLETEEHALRRGARPLAELTSGAYLCDGKHMAHPDEHATAELMRSTLARARLEADAIDYVNAHATATLVGDLEEIRATHAVFGEGVKVSSLKGHLGHALAACGAIETIACIEMLHTQTLIGTRNLEEPDPELPPVQLLQGARKSRVNRIMVNNLAFGGISASVIVSRMEA